MTINTTGTEFQVNAVFEQDQSAPAVAIDATGNGVMVWVSDGQDGSEEGIYARQFGANGELGSEFLVNSTTNNSQTAPTVAMNASGSFVVAWQDEALDQDETGIFAQRYDASGNRLGPEFRVNTTVSQSQADPAIAIDDAGNVVVTWVSEEQDGSGDGIYAQRYDSNGTPVGAEFLVNTTTENDQDEPAIAMNADGVFVIAWNSDEQDGGGEGVYAQRYDSNGTPIGSEFLVNTQTANNQDNPTVAIDAAGNFVVAWESTSQDGDGNGIYAQRYDTEGNAVGGEFLVNTTTAGNQTDPAIAMDSTGGFLVTWSSALQDGSGSGVYVRQYDSDGNAVGSEILVNTTTVDDQDEAAIALNDAGNALIVWESEDQDTDGSGIFGQRYTITASGSVPDAEPIRGDRGDNTIIGTGDDDRIFGRGGNDILRGRRGNDTINGGGGNDRINGNGGNDLLRGNGGADVLRGNGGRDELNGGGGNDNLRGGGGNDVLIGANGNDTLIGNGGRDTFEGGGGRDTFIGGGGRDTFEIVAGRGLDTIQDFNVRIDRLGVARGISFSNLSFIEQDNDTLVAINNRAAALLRGVSPGEITRSNITTL